LRDLSYCSEEELEGRLQQLVDQVDGKVKEIGKLIENVGRLRLEVISIQEELSKRHEKKTGH
jgi:hypothetical protein